ncbi:hypothetical protein V6Z12_A11G328300 [Gossypium hirsutum]
MNELKRKVMELNGVKEDTDSRMNAELQPRKKLKTEVQIWLENVERINGKVQKLNEQIGESITLTRGFHADDVLKRTREVEELIQQGKFQEGLVVDHPQWIEQVLSITTLSGESAKACLEEIWQCLMDDEVGKIGVWGMGGVGKTSIMKLINNQLLKEMGKFHIVIWITVSKDKSISKLQKDMESKIGISFCGDEDEITRAGMLFETLSRKSGLVMILDDIWEEVSLEKVGIPEPSTGSKIVLTTRSFDVCRKMSCRAIKVKPLVEKESWKLFSEIFQMLQGNALKELSEHKQSVNGLEDEVFQQLRFSYDRLKDLKLQHCFLNCALYPKDWRIEERDIVQLWIAEGLGHAIMNKLLSNCLLEVCQGSGNKRSIRMHDLVRDLALHITSAKPRSLVKADMGLREPPNVPLIWNRELEVLYPLEMSPPKCPMLTTLFLSGCGIKSIPEGFFNHMDGLKILKLSLNPIKSFPNSISNLNNLTALLLAYCDHLEYVPSLSKLGVLKELDLRGTKIKEIPNGILSKLSCLQILYVGETLVSGKEVGKLKKLEMVEEGRFYDFQDLSMYLQGFHGREEPPKYNIHMGIRQFPMIMLPRDIEELYVGNCTFCCHVNYPLFSRFVLTSLGTFSSLTYLEIRDVKKMKKLFSSNCVPLNLKVLKISLCVQLEEIIALDFESVQMPIMKFSLLKLKKLELEWLLELKNICNVDAVVVCESLKRIGVRDCPKLKRMPLKLPQVRPFSSLKLRIYVKPKKWWESVEWDDLDAKSLLKRFVNFVIW